MEEKKSNRGLVIALVLFIVLSLGLGGYIVYNQFLNEPKDNSNEVSEDTQKEEESDIEEEEQTPISVVDFFFDSVAIVKDGEVYVNVYGTTSQIDDLFGAGTFQTLVATRGTYQEYTFDHFEYSFYDNSTFNGMKLNASNVDKVYSFAYGQVIENNYGLILLNKDKTLSMISLYSLITGKADVTPISGLSNIESVITESTSSMNTYAITQTGEKINLADYIPSDYQQF